MTTQQKIDAVARDFLDRDQDSFVKIRRTGRLGWESLIPEGETTRTCSGTATGKGMS